MIKLGVLGSTKGTDLEKIIETEKLGQLNATISVVISNRKNAYILERAKTYNIPSVYISHKNRTRNAFDSEVSNVLDKYQIDLIRLMPEYPHPFTIEQHPADAEPHPPPVPAWTPPRLPAAKKPDPDGRE